MGSIQVMGGRSQGEITMNCAGWWQLVIRLITTTGHSKVASSSHVEGHPMFQPAAVAPWRPGPLAMGPQSVQEVDGPIWLASEQTRITGQPFGGHSGARQAGMAPLIPRCIQGLSPLHWAPEVGFGAG
jgi:hypothetical protein